MKVGLVGARGHVGSELIRLLAAHPRFELAYVSSRERAGERVDAHETSYSGDLRYTAPAHADLPSLGADAVILALPNGKAPACIDAFDAEGANPVVVDLSADYRFDEGWYYGLPELTRSAYRGQRRISNPGCYATAMQLALAPMREALAGPAQCFGVSGYSGAGTSPSDKNDPEKLRDNLMPYSLAGHLHEREVARHLGTPVHFLPHVAPHFRGLTITANLPLSRAFALEDVRERYREVYADEPLVRMLDHAPWVSRIAGAQHAEIGGFTLAEEGRRLVVVATLDNLLKGAATQALQNLNLAFGFAETLGIPLEPAATVRGEPVEPPSTTPRDIRS